ncbi:MAG: hypothetical protein IMF09_10565 [Proteobacteria bacterium]|nr:hypothetical protein [Pseudomonadota bacterium]
MKHILLSLAITAPLLLAACNQSDDTASPQTSQTTATKHELFDYVPADTPYLFANLDSLPADVTEAYLKNVQPMFKVLQESLKDLDQDYQFSKSADPAADSGTISDIETAGFSPLSFISSIISELADNPGMKGMENIGIKADALMVVYGLGPFPVVRMEIADETRLRATLERAFTKAGKVPEEQVLNGRKYWQAGDQQMELIASIDANEVVLSIIPSSLSADALPNILAQSKPADPLDVKKSLSALNKNNDYSNYGSGWLETQKLLDLFMNNDSSAAITMRQMIDFDAQSISQVCKDEYTSIAANFPRMHGGYQSLSTAETTASFTIELKQELANDLQKLVVAKALSVVDPGGLINLGFAMNLAKAREWLLASAAKHVENPYKCEQLAELNNNFAQAYENLNRPLPPFAGNFIGLKLKIDELELDQVGQMNPVPENIKAVFAILTSNPEMLVGMGQMFLPELADLDLTPGADPVPLALDGMPKPDEPLWAASSDKALGIAAGEGMDTQLQAFLTAGDSKNGEFLTVGIDSEFQEKMESFSESMLTEMDDSNSMSPLVPSIFDRVFMNARFTSKGLVFKQTTTLK